ncbi:putative membrane protein [Agromyces flavus]|uniref:Membrane protein n=1 Tax=Agromyces flavus TaxID=589382 RepID=A0A1H1LDS9_9MICO|nr:PH domain-containing protein [Agromyces flavus]MCP2367536.1 putative membrane protein [Agromyces flavus]SDR72724.1 putative membrane protein [Agromyces flavus]
MSTVQPLAATRDLADGEWHRLHPASPLLRGGLVFLAVLGFLLANLRERLVEVFLLLFAPGELDRDFAPSEWEGEWAEDPITGIVANGLVGWVLVGLAAVIVLVVLGFWLAWRMHSFRVTPEALEVRSGILFRSHRSARLDRIQGINVTRSLFARLFGAAKLDVSVAGQSGNVDLSYLGSAQADRLRADLLRLASGARRAAAGPSVPDAAAAVDGQAAGGLPAPAEGTGPSLAARAGGLVNRRVDEFLAPELDPSLAPPESVVRIPLPRVIASTLLGGTMVWFVVFVAIIVVGVATGQPWLLFSFVPALIGLVSYVWTRITKSLRYSIAGTPDGVRIGSGLLSTSNQTIPPGRVHAVEASQWLLWRPFGWWTVRVNVAGQPVIGSGDPNQRTLVLPVGTADDVRRVLGLLAPDAAPHLAESLEAGLAGRGDAHGFTTAPRRAAWIRPTSWRRIGLAVAGGVVLLRRGWLVRSLVLVPLARLQSVAIARGPVLRGLRLASLRLHTVAGPITPQVAALDRADADAAFQLIATDAVTHAIRDRSDHWGAEPDAG